MTKEKLSKRDQATEIIQLFREDNGDESYESFLKNMDLGRSLSVLQ